MQASARLCLVPPAVRAEAHQGGMVQLHIGSQAAVFSLEEIFGAPDTDCAVICTSGQVLAVAAEVHAGYIPTVALGKRMQEGPMRNPSSGREGRTYGCNSGSGAWTTDSQRQNRIR